MSDFGSYGDFGSMKDSLMGNDPGLCCWIDASVGLRFQGIGKLDNAPATIVEKGLISSYLHSKQ